MRNWEPSSKVTPSLWSHRFLLWNPRLCWEARPEQLSAIAIDPSRAGSPIKLFGIWQLLVRQKGIKLYKIKNVLPPYNLSTHEKSNTQKYTHAHTQSRTQHVHRQKTCSVPCELPCIHCLHSYRIFRHSTSEDCSRPLWTYGHPPLSHCVSALAPHGSLNSNEAQYVELYPVRQEMQSTEHQSLQIQHSTDSMRTANEKRGSQRGVKWKLICRGSSTGFDFVVSLRQIDATAHLRQTNRFILHWLIRPPDWMSMCKSDECLWIARALKKNCKNGQLHDPNGETWFPYLRSFRNQKLDLHRSPERLYLRHQKRPRSHRSREPRCLACKMSSWPDPWCRRVEALCPTCWTGSARPQRPGWHRSGLRPRPEKAITSQWNVYS